MVLVIMGLFILNTTLFTHTHILPDGRVVAHAHPVKDTPNPLPAGKHTHSHTEYLVLDHSVAFFIAVIAVALQLQFAFSIKHILPRIQQVPDAYHQVRSGRAPPVLVR